ncbi:MAG: hypothetical protein CMP23_16970 [Rickettsiales bacterium]|nr:hypothetical protein [Rickettsiales bacterium]|tara:strand:+ start:2335 stop:2844 length:510 start_codon:yes stop_codon:yes gene_type:complete
MLGTLLKLPLKVVRLQLKLALLPARMGARLVRHLVAADGGIPNSQEQTRHQRSPMAAPPEDPGPAFALPPNELKELLESGHKLQLIDVRQAQELANSGLIEGSLHIPTQDLPHRLDDLNRQEQVILYCHLGSRSLDAAMFLKEKGFADVRSLDGGLVGWESSGGAVASL